MMDLWMVNDIFKRFLKEVCLLKSMILKFSLMTRNNLSLLSKKNRIIMYTPLSLSLIRIIFNILIVYINQYYLHFTCFVAYLDT